MTFKASFVAVIAGLLLYGCGGGGSDNAPASTGGNNTGNSTYQLSAYLADSPYAPVLADCVSDTSCTLEQLPPVGLDHPDPTVADIMAHVVVSHDWMGMRFKQLLDIMPQQMRLLFRGVTAVVIASDVRPSHYRSDTGAIYLDPALLWQTNAEKATIDQSPDYRSDYGKDLKFVAIWRYIINNNYAWKGYSLSGSEQRTTNDTVVAFSWLLYHELAHANDCATPENMQNFDRTLSFKQNHADMEAANLCVYQKLAEQLPLQSQTWVDLAKVFYLGEDSTSAQREMNATEAGDAFAADYAMDAYSYASLKEDVAMAFETVMMKIHFNAERDTAIINQYQGDFTCDDGLIKWGQRNRMGQSDVEERSKLVASLILPSQDLSGFFDGLLTVKTIPVDHNWCEPALGGQARSPNRAAFAEQAVKQLNEGYFVD